MNNLRQLEREIGECEGQGEKLNAELETLKIRLAARNNELQTSILKGRDCYEIETEIANLQTRISGIQDTLLNLPVRLQSLKQKLAAEEKNHALFLTTSETIFDECGQQNKVIVEKLREVIQAITNQNATARKILAIAEQTGNQTSAQVSQARVMLSRNSTLQGTISKMLPTFKILQET